MIFKVLNEDTLGAAIDQAEKDLDADAVVIPEGEEDQIKRELDEALATNLSKHEDAEGDYENVLFVGEAGTGKTARILQWAKSRNVNLFQLDAKVLDPVDFSGAVAPDTKSGKAKKFSLDFWAPLNRPNSVLFLDEYNRARHDVRSSLLTLINDHTIINYDNEDQTEFLPNFLFTVAAINPYNPQYNTEPMDAAERSRFNRVDVVTNKSDVLKHYTDVYNEKLEKHPNDKETLKIKGRIKLATALLTDKEFTFDGPEEIEDADLNQTGVTNSRSLKKCLDSCDGTKDSFLRKWNGHCNPTKKPIIQRILNDYEDVTEYVDNDDKANDVLKQDSESNIFAKKQSNWDKISSLL